MRTSSSLYVVSSILTCTLCVIAGCTAVDRPVASVRQPSTPDEGVATNTTPGDQDPAPPHFPSLECKL